MITVTIMLVGMVTKLTTNRKTVEIMSVTMLTIAAAKEDIDDDDDDVDDDYEEEEEEEEEEDEDDYGSGEDVDCDVHDSNYNAISNYTG